MLVSFLSICYNKMQSAVFRRKFRGASPYKGDLEDMGKVSGVGVVKLRQFGATFLKEIKAYLEEN